MKIKTPKSCYQDQKSSAKQRGIDWLFTFEKWVRWWEKQLGPDWFSKRGHRSGQYVMARKNDKGPYAWWNVICITANQNHMDTAKNGTSTIGIKNPMAKLSEDQVREIYLCSSDEILKMVKKYKIHLGYVHRIKSKSIWGHITQMLPPAEFRGYAKGERHGCAKLSAEDVCKIFLAKGSLAKIGKVYGVNKGRVWSIKMRRSWASVTVNLGPAPHIKGRGTRTDLLP